MSFWPDLLGLCYLLLLILPLAFRDLLLKVVHSTSLRHPLFMNLQDSGQYKDLVSLSGISVKSIDLRTF